LRIAYVVRARSAVLLRTHARRLRRADLEECLSQAALELICACRRGRQFDCDVHIANAFDQRFLSRVADQHRALGGRSLGRAQFARALAANAESEIEREIAGDEDDVERIVFARDELRSVLRAARALTKDERVVLGSRLGLGGDSEEVCAARGWSRERYRKLAQRGRDRLRTFGLDGSAA